MSKTYKGWEILKMTEEGKFKEGDEIINHANISYFLNSDVGGTLFWSDECGDIMMNNNLLFAEFNVYNKFYGYNEVDYTQLEIGCFAYSNYTHQYYLISGLPRMCDNENIIYALIRLEGSGYYYKSNSLDELKAKISIDGGEIIIYKNIGIF